MAGFGVDCGDEIPAYWGLAPLPHWDPGYRIPCAMLESGHSSSCDTTWDWQGYGIRALCHCVGVGTAPNITTTTPSAVDECVFSSTTIDFREWLQKTMTSNCTKIPHSGSTYWITGVVDRYHLLSDPLWTADIISGQIDAQSLLALQQYRKAVVFNTSHPKDWDVIIPIKTLNYMTDPGAHEHVFIKGLYCFHPTDNSLFRSIGSCSNCSEMCPGQTYFKNWYWQMDDFKVSIEGYDTLFPTLQWKRGQTHTFMYTLAASTEHGKESAEVYLFTADFPSACGCPCGLNLVEKFECCDPSCFASNCSTAARDNNISACWLKDGSQAVRPNTDWRDADDGYEHWRLMFTYNHCVRIRTPYANSGATVNVTCSIPLDEPLDKIYYAVPHLQSWVRFGQIDIVDPDSDTPTTTTTTPAPTTTTTAEPTTTTPAPTTTVLQTTTPAPVQGQWILAGLDESCATACQGISLQCDLRYQPITAETSTATIINYFSQVGVSCIAHDVTHDVNAWSGAWSAFYYHVNGEKCHAPDSSAISLFECDQSFNSFTRLLCYCVDPPPLDASCVDDPNFVSQGFYGKTCADFACTEDRCLNTYCNENWAGMSDGETMKSPCYWCCAACTSNGKC